MFKPGEHVVYPQVGLGVIVETMEKQVHGEELSFYRLEFPLHDLEVLVPVSRAKENGMRKIMSSDQMNTLFSDVLACKPESKSAYAWHHWRKKTQLEIKSGDPLLIGKIYRYLQSLTRKKSLSYTERTMMQKVEEMLIGEIAAVKKITIEKARNLVRIATKAELLH